MILPDHVLEKIDPADRKRLGKAGVTRIEAIEKATLRSERDLQGQIANYLRLHGVWFTRSNMSKRTTNTVGTPDFIFCLNGRFCAVEVKFGQGQLSQEQEAALAAIRSTGGFASVIRSLPEFIEFLKEAGK